MLTPNATATVAYACQPWCTNHIDGVPPGRTPEPEDQVCHTTLATDVAQVSMFHTIDDGTRFSIVADELSPAGAEQLIAALRSQLTTATAVAS